MDKIKSQRMNMRQLHVGDKTDTSPYRDMSEQDYISTPAYIRNMNLLINYLKSIKKTNVK